jgi:hypothetical protein
VDRVRATSTLLIENAWRKSTMPSIKRSPEVLSLALSIAGGAAIWALSPAMTGQAEPWDSGSLYYVTALALLGLALGAMSARPLVILLIALGAWLGQVLYIVLFLPLGPLFVAGLVILAAYLVLPVIGAAVSVLTRRSLARRVAA